VGNLYLPYKATNPRTIRGARKRGWTVMQPRNGYEEKISWTSLCIWCERSMTGYWIASFPYQQFAFESSADATMFQLKWG
jgi:hypothetical protein